jgi:hypothetical protein
MKEVKTTRSDQDERVPIKIQDTSSKPWFIEHCRSCGALRPRSNPQCQDTSGCDYWRTFAS